MLNTIFIEWGTDWGWLLGLIFFFVIFWLVSKALGKKNTLEQEQTKNKSALETLKERYAKGLISKKEFEEKRGAIQ